MVGDGGTSIRKCFEILRPGWVAMLKFVIMASAAAIIVSKSRFVQWGYHLLLPGGLHLESRPKLAVGY
jgi:hypothetical protein